MISLQIKNSKISGLGLFAVEPIAEGQRIFKIFNLTDNGFGSELEPANFINHCKNNNMKIVRAGNELYFHAKQNIPAGDELTSNYSELINDFRYPRNILEFEENTAKHQYWYDATRKYKPDMYNRPIGTRYFFE